MHPYSLADTASMKAITHTTMGRPIVPATEPFTTPWYRKVLSFFTVNGIGRHRRFHDNGRSN